MKVPIKIVMFGALILVIIEALTIFRYERLLKSIELDMKKMQVIEGGVSAKKKYTAQEIIHLINSSPAYLGDTIIIFDNGDMESSLSRFQGTINSVLNSKPNMDIVMGQMETNKLPLQYNVYTLAAQYYRQQYPNDLPAKAKKQ